MSSPSTPIPSPGIAAVPETPGNWPVSSPLASTTSLPIGFNESSGRPTYAELPLGKKASLVRIQQKRIGRLRGKAPYVTPWQQFACLCVKERHGE